MKAVQFSNKGLRLDADVFYPPNSTEGRKYPAILFVHGWTSSRDRSYQYAESLASLGYVCMVFDMRGHGTSEGERLELSSKDFLDDVLVAYDYLASLPEVDPENISANGSSFGGFLVALLSSQRKLKSLVLRAPADYPDEEFSTPKKLRNWENIVAWRSLEKDETGTDALRSLSAFSGKVLFIESENDERIPRQTILNFIKALPNQSQVSHVVMEGAPHSIKGGPFRDQVGKILVDWFSKLSEL